MGCNCSKKMPSAVRMAVNATASAGRIVRAAWNGDGIKANPKIVTARLEACAKCDSMTRWPKDESFMRCSQCGCWLNGKKGLAKSEYLTEFCPLGKWVTP
jgi:hypothetical protein